MDDDNLDKNKKLFPQKLWELIHDERYQSCLRWSEDGHRVYLNREDFEESYLKKPDQNQFNTQKAISFVRQMNMYGFKKVDDFYYENENFKRDSPDSLKRMIRRHPARNTDFITQEPCNNEYETNNFLKTTNFQTNNINNNNNNNHNNNIFMNTNIAESNIKDHQDTQETDYTLNNCSPTRSPISPIPLAVTDSGPYTQSNESMRVGHYDSISPQNIGTDEEIMQRGHWTLPQDKSMCTAEEVRRGQRINGVSRDKCPIIGCNKRVSPTNIYPALISHLYGYHFSGFNSYRRYHKPKYCRLIHNNSWNDRVEDLHVVHESISNQNPSNLSAHANYSFLNTCVNNNIENGNIHGSDEDIEHNTREDVIDDGEENYQEDSLNSYSPIMSNLNLKKRNLTQTPTSSSSCSPSKMLKHQRQLQQQQQQQQQPQDLSNHSHQNQRKAYDNPAFSSLASQLVKKISDQREVKLDTGASIEAEKFAEKLLFTLIDDAAMIVEHQNESKSPMLGKNNKEMLIDASSLTLALKFMPSRLAAALNEKSISQ